MASRSTGSRGHPQPPPIIVEEYFDTYVKPQLMNLEDDGVEAMTRKEYLDMKKRARSQSSRATGGSPAQVPRSTFTPPARRVPNVVNHPPQFGNADIQRMRQHQQQHTSENTNKRSSPSSLTVGSQKRRKLDTPQASGSAPAASSSRQVGEVTIPVGPPGRRSNMPVPSSASSAPAPAAKSQAEKRHLGAFELNSDGELEEVDVKHKVFSPPRKKQKTEITPPEDGQNNPYIIVSPNSEDDGHDMEIEFLPQSIPPESAHAPEPHPKPESEPELEPPLPLPDEDDESDWDHIGDICDSARWQSSTYHQEDDESDLDRLDITRLEIGETIKAPQIPLKYIHSDTSKWAVQPPRRSVGSSDQYKFHLAAARIAHVRPRNRSRQVFTTAFYVRPWDLDFDLHSVKMQYSFKKAPGTVNKIEQNGAWTAIASASVGGLPDSNQDDRAMAYNRPGSLLTWGPGGLDMPLGHTGTQDPIKYYAVHDVKFDPLSSTIVSSGADRKVRVWNLSDVEVDEVSGGMEVDLNVAPESKSRWRNDAQERFNCVPHDIVFKPESSLLAVAEKSCHIYQLTPDEGFGKRLDERCRFHLHPRNKPHTIGSMVWGTGPTQDRLFSSSEPDPSAHVNVPWFEGVHKVYNVVKGAFECHLDAQEAGDVMAIDSTGSLLALSTRGAVDRHILRLYDVKNQKPKATSTIHLETFEQRYDGFEGEVNCAAFSPDGIYLALGRNDNRVHLYDVRMLDRGPLLDYGHWGESRVSGEGECLYGVVKAQWLWSEATQRNALVTGGEDGCVRMWNPLLSAKDEDNGRSVARMNSDIAHFSIGDRFKGEHQLVAGDSSGEVMIFNNIII